jgi:hypothetical protein
MKECSKQSYLIMAKTTIIIRNTIKIKKRIFRIPQPVLDAPLKPKIPEKTINTTAIIARIQKMLILYSFTLVIHKINPFILCIKKIKLL